MSERGHIRVMCKIQEKEMLLYVRSVKGHCTSCGRERRGMSGKKMSGDMMSRKVQYRRCVWYVGVEGSELNIKWESCVVRYVWYVGWKEGS